MSQGSRTPEGQVFLKTLLKELLKVDILKVRVEHGKCAKNQQKPKSKNRPTKSAKPLKKTTNRRTKPAIPLKEIKFKDVLASKFQRILDKKDKTKLEKKILCKKNIPIKNFFLTSKTATRWYWSGAIVDLAFETKDLHFLPFLVEVKIQTGELSLQSKEVSELPQYMISDLQQTVVHCLSGQAFLQQVTYGNDSAMKSLIVYPDKLVEINLQPASDCFKWDLNIKVFQNNYEKVMTNFISELWEFERNTTDKPLSWVPCPSCVVPYTPEKSNQGFVFFFNSENEMVKEEFKTLLKSIFPNVDLDGCELSHLVLKLLSSLLTDNVELRLSRLYIVKLEGGLLGGRKMKLQKMDNSPQPKFESCLKHPYIDFALTKRLVLMKHTGETLNAGVCWDVSTKEAFFHQVCLSALRLCPKYCHNDIRCANITFLPTENSFCLIDWDACGPEIKVVKKDGRYPPVSGFNSVDTRYVFTTIQLLHTVFCLSSGVDANENEKVIQEKGPALLEDWTNVLKIRMEKSFQFVPVEPNVEESFSTFGRNTKSQEQHEVLSRCLEVLMKALEMQLPEKVDVSQYFS